MKYNPDKHHRRSIRLKEYDYSQPGWYFVTICTQNRVRLFGDIVNGRMVLNDSGKMVENIWNEIPQNYNNTKIDFYQIMPNHFHGIINIVGTDPRVCPEREQTYTGQSQGIALKLSLPDLVKRYKSLTTKRFRDWLKQNDLPFFGVKLWQRNYYEHIIRDEQDLNRIRQYIVDNLLKWQDDK